MWNVNFILWGENIQLLIIPYVCIHHYFAGNIFWSELVNSPTTCLPPPKICPKCNCRSRLLPFRGQLFNHQHLRNAFKASVLLRHQHGLPQGKGVEPHEPQCPHRPHGHALLGAGAELHDADQPQGREKSSSHFRNIPKLKYLSVISEQPRINGFKQVS